MSCTKLEEFLGFPMTAIPVCPESVVTLAKRTPNPSLAIFFRTEVAVQRDEAPPGPLWTLPLALRSSRRKGVGDGGSGS